MVPHVAPQAHRATSCRRTLAWREARRTKSDDDDDDDDDDYPSNLQATRSHSSCWRALRRPGRSGCRTER
eukprot:9499215-Pyramimonas_sp.AAC.2